MRNDADDILTVCLGALETARPYVVDGRGDGETDRALALVDDAIARTLKFRDDHSTPNSQLSGGDVADA